MLPEDIIGLKIKDLRFQNVRENDQGLKEFFCYLKLSNEKIIEIPIWPEAPQMEEQSSLVANFDAGLEFQLSIRRKVLDAEIEDIFFRDTGDFFSSPAILKLSNGFYLSEENYASEGRVAGLRLWSQLGFEKEKQNWKGLRSYKEDFR